jgi:hypothetical protein
MLLFVCGINRTVPQISPGVFFEKSFSGIIDIPEQLAKNCKDQGKMF